MYLNSNKQIQCTVKIRLNFRNSYKYYYKKHNKKWKSCEKVKQKDIDIWDNNRWCLYPHLKWNKRYEMQGKTIYQTQTKTIFSIKHAFRKNHTQELISDINNTKSRSYFCRKKKINRKHNNNNTWIYINFCNQIKVNDSVEMKTTTKWKQGSHYYLT